jgi:CRISPR/Cas system CMR-associated protein Cmr1 (group 7 of RAMP superfamily)
MERAMEIVKVRPLGNKHSMNIGGLIFKIKKGVGEVKMAPEFFLAPSNVQLNLLDDWINELEEMYNAEIRAEGTLKERARITTRTHVRTYDDTTD